MHFLSRSTTGKQFWQCVLSRCDRPSPPHRVDTIAARQTFSGRILVHHHYRSERCKSSHTFGRVCALIHVNADGEPSPSRESARQIFHVWKRDLQPHVSPTLPTPPPQPTPRPFVQEETSSVSEVHLTVSEPGQSAQLDKPTQESAGTCGGSR